MITNSIPLWREIQKQNINNASELASFLELNEDQQKKILKAPSFPLNLPIRLAKKIKKQCLDDPILKQFVPLVDEQDFSKGFLSDPVDDSSFKKSEKLLHKYDGRALLVTTSACAMHCRYCFRKNFSYQTKPGFQKELQLIKDDPSINELILSGGDPLSLSNQTLQNLFKELDQIPHIKRIRFHTRFVIGIPERIDDEFLSTLSCSSKQIWFVIHCNHPNELDTDIFYYLKKIQCLGIPVINQSVLLKGVNDNIDVLKKLSLDLVNQGVLPYYLHQLDKVQGSAHFEVTQQCGLDLIRLLTESLSGYAVPKYVQEIPGELSKTPIVLKTY